MAHGSEIEAVLFAVRDYFRENIKTYTDGINAAKRDGHILQPFKDAMVSELSPLQVAAMPAALLRPLKTGVKVLTMGEDEISVQVLHSLVIGGGDEEDLLIRSMRYVDAVREMYTADTSCGGRLDGILASSGENWLEVDFYDQIPGVTPRKVIACSAWFAREVARS